MSYDVTKQKKLWMYAIIMFACAFIVILATGYSQIKLKNSYNQANSQASSAKKQTKSVEQNLTSANKTIDSLRKELDSTTANFNKLSENYELSKKRVESYDALIKAQTAYGNGNYIDCALLLKTKCTKNILEGNALALYKKMEADTVNQAAENLYYMGYKHYANREFSSAIVDFGNSLKIRKDAYYSDDCMYFTGCCQYSTNKKQEALKSLKNLLKTFPKTAFAPDAKRIIKSLTI